MKEKEKEGLSAVPLPERCDGCPYGRVGFVCRDSDGETCMRTDVEELSTQRPGRKS